MRMKFSFQNLLKKQREINLDTNQEQDKIKKSGVSSLTMMWRELFVNNKMEFLSTEVTAYSTVVIERFS